MNDFREFSAMYNENYLMHSGRKGMRWGKSIFQDDYDPIGEVARGLSEAYKYVHQIGGRARENAYNYALMYLQNIDKRLRPFILHRIDKETSGVLVFAKNEFIHSKLKMNWNDLVKKREYYAIVEGKLEKKHDILKMYLKENENNLVYETKDRNGSLAITEYEVIKENNDYSVVKCDIKTGRKNQIRVAFKTIGHPIVGDEKYGFTKNPLKRLGLHASKLEFVHPDSLELFSFEAKCPNTFFSLFNKKDKMK